MSSTVWTQLQVGICLHYDPSIYLAQSVLLFLKDVCNLMNGKIETFALYLVAHVRDWGRRKSEGLNLQQSSPSFLT